MRVFRPRDVEMQGPFGGCGIVSVAMCVTFCDEKGRWVLHYGRVFDKGAVRSEGENLG